MSQPEQIIEFYIQQTQLDTTMDSQSLGLVLKNYGISYEAMLSFLQTMEQIDGKEQTDWKNETPQILKIFKMQNVQKLRATMCQNIARHKLQLKEIQKQTKTQITKLKDKKKQASIEGGTGKFKQEIEQANNELNKIQNVKGRFQRLVELLNKFLSSHAIMKIHSQKEIQELIQEIQKYSEMMFQLQENASPVRKQIVRAWRIYKGKGINNKLLLSNVIEVIIFLQKAGQIKRVKEICGSENWEEKLFNFYCEFSHGTIKKQQIKGQHQQLLQVFKELNIKKQNLTDGSFQLRKIDGKTSFDILSTLQEILCCYNDNFGEKITGMSMMKEEFLELKCYFFLTGVSIKATETDIGWWLLLKSVEVKYSYIQCCNLSNLFNINPSSVQKISNQVQNVRMKMSDLCIH